MRLTLWFLGLFGVAVALALFASGNPATVTVFWPPHRIDLSLNLVVLLLMVLFALVVGALKAAGAVLAMPAQARSWRQRHQERIMHSALLDALAHLIAGRFIRARKSAELVLARETALSSSGQVWPDAARLRVLAHLLAAESAQALQDKPARETHFQAALAESARPDASGTRDGVQLRAVRWAVTDRNSAAALDWLAQLPSGVARRTVALRLRLKVARLAGQPELALDTARLLLKHKAFTEAAGLSLVRALALEVLQKANDPEQLERSWAQLESTETNMPEVAMAATARMLQLEGNAAQAFEWLMPVWTQLAKSPKDLSDAQKVALVRVMEIGFSSAGAAIDTGWLARIQQAQQADPGNANLQYLAGVACLHLQLWGKAQQLIRQALPRLQDTDLLTRAWQMLAELAQRQGDQAQALEAWKSATQVALARRKV